MRGMSTNGFGRMAPPIRRTRRAIPAAWSPIRSRSVTILKDAATLRICSCVAESKRRSVVSNCTQRRSISSSIWSMAASPVMITSACAASACSRACSACVTAVRTRKAIWCTRVRISSVAASLTTFFPSGVRPMLPATDPPPSAVSLRHRVATFVHEGWSDARIEDWVVGRFGSNALLVPPTSGVSSTLYLVPTVLVGGAAVGLGYFLWRRRSPRDGAGAGTGGAAPGTDGADEADLGAEQGVVP